MTTTGEQIKTGKINFLLTKAEIFDNVSASDTNTPRTEGREYMNTEVIRERKSVRTYKDQEIPEQTLDKVRNYLQKDTGLFDVPIEFTILNAKNANVGSPVIIGADTYIAGKYKRQKPLNQAASGIWNLPLEMVRLAPSATNKQPWRAVAKKDRVHFYEKKTKGYAKESTGDIQKVDLGIALCHFEIAAEERRLKGRFIQTDPGIPVEEDTEYIATFELER